MAKTLRVRSRTGWVTKPVADTPANRLLAEEIDDNFLAVEDAAAALAGATFTGDIAAPKITASTGILFGTDTAAANTLDDYETGTWTVTMAGVTVTTGIGMYTKIGDMVFAQFEFETNATTSATNARLGGLPFPRNLASEARSAGFLGYFPATPYASLLFEVGQTIEFREAPGGDIMTITQISGKLMWGTLIYKAA